MTSSSNAFWNLVLGAALFGMFLLFFAPLADPDRDRFGEFLLRIAPESDEHTPRAALPNPSPLPVGSLVWEKGDVLTKSAIASMEEIPDSIADRFVSPEDRCVYRFLNQTVITIHSKTLVIVDLTPVSI
ncbi:MAG: hypothetical protein P1U58_01410 [Verrucomicrobiales bacterium]|nr:hypothetical protein [Verrucomicrobiales bacterium]